MLWKAKARRVDFIPACFCESLISLPGTMIVLFGKLDEVDVCGRYF